MTIFQYDHTFEGLLCALFDAYSKKTFPDILIAETEQLPLFYDTIHRVITAQHRAERVWSALKKKLSEGALSQLTYCWLSEQPEAPRLLFRYMQKTIDASYSIETNFADPDVLAVFQLSRKVSSEQHKVIQFMRFQKATDGIYYGIMAPKYNVFPLTISHFQDRFADQPWLIYDTKRKYGYYYNCHCVNEITFMQPEQAHLINGILDNSMMDKQEKLFQTLWKSYFNSICIKERLNPVKHKKDMPIRFWKYLTEKQ